MSVCVRLPRTPMMCSLFFSLVTSNCTLPGYLLRSLNSLSRESRTCFCFSSLLLALSQPTISFRFLHSPTTNRLFRPFLRQPVCPLAPLRVFSRRAFPPLASRSHAFGARVSHGVCVNAAAVSALSEARERDNVFVLVEERPPRGHVCAPHGARGGARRERSRARDRSDGDSA